MKLVLLKLEEFQNNSPNKETCSEQARYYYHCEVCDKEFSNKSNLKTHKKEAHSKPVLTCDICDDTFEDETILTTHKATHTFQCSNCDYKSTRKCDLETHIKIHALKCESCPYHAIHARDLRRHRYTMHPRCNICPYIGKNEADMKRHHNTTHVQEETYPCNICNHSAPSKEELKAHFSAEHQQQKTRIFSSRRYSTSISRVTPRPSQDLFRPWSTSAPIEPGPSTTNTAQCNPGQTIPQPFAKQMTNIPEGFLKTSQNSD